jgi:hypothetical protein
VIVSAGPLYIKHLAYTKQRGGDASSWSPSCGKSTASLVTGTQAADARTADKDGLPPHEQLFPEMQPTRSSRITIPGSRSTKLVN